MNLFDGLEKIVERNYRLAQETWYGLGGDADYFIRPQTIEQLARVVQHDTGVVAGVDHLGNDASHAGVALGEDGRILAANRSALIQLDGAEREMLVGRRLDVVFDIKPEQLMSSTSPFREGVQAIHHAGDRRRYYASVRAPASSRRVWTAPKAERRPADG